MIIFTSSVSFKYLEDISTARRYCALPVSCTPPDTAEMPAPDQLRTSSTPPSVEMLVNFNSLSAPVASKLAIFKYVLP